MAQPHHTLYETVNLHYPHKLSIELDTVYSIVALTLGLISTDEGLG